MTSYIMMYAHSATALEAGVLSCNNDTSYIMMYAHSATALEAGVLSCNNDTSYIMMYAHSATALDKGCYSRLTFKHTYVLDMLEKHTIVVWRGV